MENEVKKPMALWRKLIIFIPLGVIAFCLICLCRSLSALASLTPTPQNKTGGPSLDVSTAGNGNFSAPISGKSTKIRGTVSGIFKNPFSASMHVEEDDCLWKCAEKIAQAGGNGIHNISSLEIKIGYPVPAGNFRLYSVTNPGNNNKDFVRFAGRNGKVFSARASILGGSVV